MPWDLPCLPSQDSDSADLQISAILEHDGDCVAENQPEAVMPTHAFHGRHAHRQYLVPHTIAEQCQNYQRGTHERTRFLDEMVADWNALDRRVEEICNHNPRMYHSDSEEIACIAADISRKPTAPILPRAILQRDDLIDRIRAFPRVVV